MIDYTKGSKQNVNSAVEKLKKDLMDNKLKKIIDMQ